MIELEPLVIDLPPLEELLPAVASPSQVAPSTPAQRSAQPPIDSAPRPWYTREDIVRLLTTDGWTHEPPAAYRRGSHWINVYLMSVGFVCACCREQGHQLPFHAAYGRILRLSGGGA